MMTECNPLAFTFHPLHQRDVVARFDGGKITSEAGALLLREVEHRTGRPRRFAAGFTDPRDPERIEHPVEELVLQRVGALALGHEDLHDHDPRRHDPLLAVLVGQRDPLGEARARQQDQGQALAGKSTLNHLELTPPRATAARRYPKITVNRRAVQDGLGEAFLESFDRPPQRRVLDLDAT